MHQLGDKIKDGFFCSVDVISCIDYAEFKALDSKEEEYIKFVISASYINFDEGSPVLARFQKDFPIGTNTRTNLDLMLSKRSK